MKKGVSKYNDLAGTASGNWLCEGFAGNYRLFAKCLSCNNTFTLIPRDFNRGLGCRDCYPRWGSNSKNFKGVGEISISYIRQLRFDAKARNLEFDVTPEYLWQLFLNQKSKCALSGQLLSFGIHTKEKTKEQSRTASLDRIDSSKGYVNGNLQWLHKDVNMMKKHYSQDYFIKVCKLIYENISNTSKEQNS